jgi:hypothetical protein
MPYFGVPDHLAAMDSWKMKGCNWEDYPAQSKDAWKSPTKLLNCIDPNI